MNDERPTMNESPNRELRTANCGLRFFIQEIDQEIRAVKKLENERMRYMTYAMKMQEERKEGFKKGQAAMRRDLAVEMLKDKKPIQEIIHYTKLTEEEIQ